MLSDGELVAVHSATSRRRIEAERFFFGAGDEASQIILRAPGSGPMTAFGFVFSLISGSRFALAPTPYPLP
jgi:hypothetical protein